MSLPDSRHIVYGPHGSSRDNLNNQSSSITVVPILVMNVEDTQQNISTDDQSNDRIVGASNASWYG